RRGVGSRLAAGGSLRGAHPLPRRDFEPSRDHAVGGVSMSAIRESARSRRADTLVVSLVCGVCAVAALGMSAPSRAETLTSPPLALSLVTGASTPRLRLEQRQIDRSWGPSEDSVYREIEIPEWRSESAATLLSAAVPGAGQAYVGSQRAWV